MSSRECPPSVVHCVTHRVVQCSAKLCIIFWIGRVGMWRGKSRGRQPSRPSSHRHGQLFSLSDDCKLLNAVTVQWLGPACTCSAGVQACARLIPVSNFPGQSLGLRSFASSKQGKWWWWAVAPQQHEQQQRLNRCCSAAHSSGFKAEHMR
jgi:hypothetical protein